MRGSWFVSLLLLVLFVASIGLLLNLPSSYQHPVLFVIPLVIVVAFLLTLDIG